MTHDNITWTYGGIFFPQRTKNDAIDTESLFGRSIIFVTIQRERGKISILKPAGWCLLLKDVSHVLREMNVHIYCNPWPLSYLCASWCANFIIFTVLVQSVLI